MKRPIEHLPELLRRSCAALFYALLVAAPLSGCGGGGTSTLSQVAPLQIDLVADKFEYRPGEPVSYTYRITNPSDRTVVISGGMLLWLDGSGLAGVPSSIQRDDTVVWSVSNHAQVITSIYISPHSSLPGRMVWDQTDDTGARVPPGTYVIRAFASIDTVDGSPVTSMSAIERMAAIRIR